MISDGYTAEGKDSASRDSSSRDGYANSQPSSNASSADNSPVLSTREWPRQMSATSYPAEPVSSVDFTVHAEGSDIQSYFTALTQAATGRLDPNYIQTNLPFETASSPISNESVQNHPQDLHLPLLKNIEKGRSSTGDLNLKARITTPNGQSYLSIVCPFDERVHYKPPESIETFTAEQLSEYDSVFSKEYAELSMVCRVLSMALDPTTPLLDRVKFLCIVSHYIDEHFSKRLGYLPKLDLRDLQTATINLRRQVRPKTKYEEDLTTALRTITEKQAECLAADLLPKLYEKGIEVVPAKKLAEEEAARMTAYFKKNLRPALTPILLDPTHPFPLLRSHEIYLYVKLYDPKKAEKKVVLFRTPTKRRLIPIDDTGFRFVTSEDICVANLGLVCHSMIVLNYHVFRVTRNTKIIIEEDRLEDMDDLFDFIVEEVHRRRQAPATRLEVMSSAPPDMVSLLVNKLYLDEMDVYRVDTPFLDLSSCMSLAFVPLPWLRQVTKDPVVPSSFKGLHNRLIADPGAIFSVLRKQDVLIEYPRDNFENSAVLYLHAAARDPQVQSIKSVLYRGGSDSPIVAALIRAAKNGKEVSVVIELKASFDEIQNSEYARALQVAGCNVTYGVMGLKVHSKIMLVVREEKDGSLCTYVNVSTGNFNPNTAKLYTDYSLFTCDKDICTDVLDVFNTLTGYSNQTVYRTLLVAPVNMLDRFIELIRAEAESAKAGKPARIACQMNGLSDKTITRELYEASQAGVRIDLIVRGACRVRPGIKGMSENINVYSWVGQLLQHRRVYYFHAEGKGKYFIGSADWRTRNLTDRIEVVVPIKDPSLCKRLSKAFELIDDENFVWRMSPDGHYFKGFPVTKSPPVSVSIAPLQRFPAEKKSGTSESDSEDRNLEQFKLGQSSSSAHEKFLNEMANAAVSSIGKVSDEPEKKKVLSSEAENGPDSKSGKKLKKARARYVVNINGNNKTVDKVAVGAVPIRFKEGIVGMETIEVLMVARGEDDSWAVPKGGRNEGETQLEATVRIAREKAGVLSYEIVANLGWMEVSKGSKQIAFQTVVLLAKELGTFVSRQRRRTWMSIEEAIHYSRGEKGHTFTEKALSRAVSAVRGKLRVNGDRTELILGGTPLTKSTESSVASTPSASILLGPGNSSALQIPAARESRKREEPQTNGEKLRRTESAG